jgi:hypothetical protein
VLSLHPVAARSHQGGISYAQISVAETEVEIALQVAYADWVPLVDLDSDRDGALTPDEARAHLARLGGATRTQILVFADGQACPGDAADVEVGTRLGTPFTLLRMVYRCPARIRTLAVTCHLFAREHPGHQVLAVIEDRSDLGAPVRQHVFGPGTELLELSMDRAEGGRLGAVAQFLRLGVSHIFTGYDHVLFLLGLLLGATGLGALVRIVTAFTVAHTLTLVLATLGYVSLDMRLVESTIALSIAYVALENLLVRHRGRWMLAFVFGLVHGFGFSNVLREMRIPRDTLAWSLASFNVGVELGQLVSVSALYPVLVWSRRHAWNAWMVRAVSAAIGLAGLYWFVERALLSA